MTYYESAEGVTISNVAAKRLIMTDHGHDIATWDRFLEEQGAHDTYDAQKVLDWLGYDEV